MSDAKCVYIGSAVKYIFVRLSLVSIRTCDCIEMCVVCFHTENCVFWEKKFPFVKGNRFYGLEN